MTLERAIAFWLGILTAIILFLQYFLPTTWLSNLAQPFLFWIIALTATALVLAAANLWFKHLRRIPDSISSTLLVAGFGVALVAGLLPNGFEAGLGQWIYRWLIAPGLAALFALLPIFLAYALYRHLQLRSVGSVLLALSLVLVLLGQTPLIAERVPVLAALRHDILIGPAAVAFRALIILLALGLTLNTWARLRNIIYDLS